jgi:hypothetical protein
MLTFDEQNASMTDVEGLVSLTDYPRLSRAISTLDSIRFIYYPPAIYGSTENEYNTGYSTTFPSPASVISRQDIIRVNKDGKTVTNKTLHDSSGLYYFESDDFNYLSVYEKVKGSAVYFRLVKTDAKGNKLWDKPFLTMRYRSVPTDFRDTIIIKQILQTSDQGYIIWGLRQRTSDF